VASHALDELMRRLLVLHRLLENEERLAPAWCLQAIIGLAFADVEQGDRARR
jgi:hypothetical protein